MLNCLEIVKGGDEAVCGLEMWSNKLEGVSGMENYVLIQCVIDGGAGASVGPRLA